MQDMDSEYYHHAPGVLGEGKQNKKIPLVRVNRVRSQDLMVCRTAPCCVPRPRPTGSTRNTDRGDTPGCFCNSRSSFPVEPPSLARERSG